MFFSASLHDSSTTGQTEVDNEEQSRSSAIHFFANMVYAVLFPTGFTIDKFAYCSCNYSKISNQTSLLHPDILDNTHCKLLLFRGLFETYVFKLNSLSVCLIIEVRPEGPCIVYKFLCCIFKAGPKNGAIPILFFGTISIATDHSQIPHQTVIFCELLS